MAAPGFGDIVLAISICKKIIEWGLYPENCADKNAAGCAMVIEWVLGILEMHEKHMVQLRNASQSMPDPAADGIYNSLALNIRTTLDECATLLAKYQRPGRWNFLTNVDWNWNGKPQWIQLEDRLRRNIAFLNTINGILLSSGNSAGLQNQQELDEPNFLHECEPKFEEALLKSPVRGAERLEEIPMHHLISAFWWRWHYSTKGVRRGDMIQYEPFLNLIKATWLILLVERRTHQSWPSREVLNQLKTEISQEYEREEVHNFNPRRFGQLQAEDFEIWPPDASSLPQKIEHEEQIFSGHIIPEGPGADVELRIYRTSGNAFVVRKLPGCDYQLNPKHHSIMPNYICDMLSVSHNSNGHTLAVRSSEAVIGRYSFRDRTHVVNMQDAITEYRTRCSIPLRGWDFSKNKLRRSNSVCQIWSPRPRRNAVVCQNSPSSDSPPLTPPDTAQASVFNAQLYDRVQTIYNGGTIDWAELEIPRNPSVIIFDRENQSRSYRAIKIEVTPDLVVSTVNRDREMWLDFSMKKGKFFERKETNFTVRITESAGTEAWNLFPLAGKPDAESPRMESHVVSNFGICFKEAAQRQEFYTIFVAASNQRNLKWMDWNTIDKTIKSAQGKVRSEDRIASQRVSRTSTRTTSSRSMSNHSLEGWNIPGFPQST